MFGEIHILRQRLAMNRARCQLYGPEKETLGVLAIFLVGQRVEDPGFPRIVSGLCDDGPGLSVWFLASAALALPMDWMHGD